MADKNDLIWITFQASKEQREKLERIAEADTRTMSRASQSNRHHAGTGAERKGAIMTGYIYTEKEIVAINESQRERARKIMEQSERDRKNNPCSCSAGLVDNRCPWHGTPPRK